MSATVEIVELGYLQPITSIPDCVEKGTLPFVVALQPADSNDYWVIDNWRLVEDAEEEHSDKVFCLVYKIETANEVDKMMAKTAIRLAPTAGQIRFTETLRNVVLIGQQLRASGAQECGHGGNRKGNAHGGCKENDLLTGLCAWMDSSPRTITAYLTHARYLDNHALSVLVNDPACNRVFFESLRQAKSTLVQELKTGNIADEAITEEVSKWLLAQWGEYKNGKKKQKAKGVPTTSGDSVTSAGCQTVITPHAGLSEGEGGTVDQHEETGELQYRVEALQIGAEQSDNVRPFEDLDTRVVEAAQKLIEGFTLAGSSAEERARLIDAAMGELSKIRHELPEFAREDSDGAVTGCATAL